MWTILRRWRENNRTLLFARCSCGLEKIIQDSNYSSGNSKCCSKCAAIKRRKPPPTCVNCGTITSRRKRCRACVPRDKYSCVSIAKACGITKQGVSYYIDRYGKHKAYTLLAERYNAEYFKEYFEGAI